MVGGVYVVVVVVVALAVWCVTCTCARARACTRSSGVVSKYLEASGLQGDLDKLGFNTVGYGCTTCIG